MPRPIACVVAIAALVAGLAVATSAWAADVARRVSAGTDFTTHSGPAAHAAGYGAWQEKYAGMGRMIVGPFESAPFPHPARKDGHTYHGTVYSAPEHYADNTVAIFIPKGFRVTDHVDFIVHFHGWRNTVAGTFAKYRLAEQLVASGRNAVLVVPEGPHDAPDSFGGKLEDAGGFRRFMDEVAATLRREPGFASATWSIGRVVLSGHSGGYGVMGGIVERGGMDAAIAEVWLFDALYGRTEAFTAWADRSHGRLIDIYTDHGGTKEETEKLMAQLKARGTSFVAAEETKLDPAALKAAGYVFIHTDLAHDDVPMAREEFRIYLETSGLAAVADGQMSGAKGG